MPRRRFRSMVIPSISAIAMRRISLFLAIFFTILTVVQNFTDWATNVSYVSNLSTIALSLGCLATWQAARVEVVQTEADVPGDVVQAIVEKTEINPDPTVV